MARFIRCLTLALLILAATPGSRAIAGGSGVRDQMEFGVESAKKGLWREALFRWERARKLSPANPRILSNLAVAYETAGRFDQAADLYKEALKIDPGNRDIKRNFELFSAFYKEYLSRKDREGETPQR